MLRDVLFGDANPGGKLAQTWPKSLEQLPPMMDYDLTRGRTYQYFEGEPQYPFGYGLSYTTFEIANLRRAGATAEFPPPRLPGRWRRMTIRRRVRQPRPRRSA